MNSLRRLKQELKNLGSDERALASQRYFKTGSGQYGEGDMFLGLNAKEQRTIAKEYSSMGFSDLQNLLDSKIHEERMVALLILANKYAKNENQRKEIFNFYMDNSKRINNWDLVDVSAPRISGKYLLDKPKKKLHEFSKSDNLWEKRISIVSTFAFIREGQFEDALKISETLLKDEHDLIHKAVGWMLREIGKKNQRVLEDFLKKFHKVMPRTMLRYSIERFPEELRKFYMKK